LIVLVSLTYAILHRIDKLKC